MNIKELASQIHEAYCLSHGLPVTRRHTDAEVAAAQDRLKDAEQVIESFEWSDDGSHRTPDYAKAEQLSGVAGRTIKAGE